MINFGHTNWYRRPKHDLSHLQDKIAKKKAEKLLEEMTPALASGAIECYWKHLKELACVNILHDSIEDVLASAKYMLILQNDPTSFFRMSSLHYYELLLSTIG